MRRRVHEVLAGVAGWIEGFYNRKRLYSSIVMMSPVEYELKMSQTAWKQAA
ncbi:integrase [Mobiluncus mulieris]|uniref:integrase n=1 Tax=Mobiluncus mulieris TaxID=2052 RepID=UPI001BA93AD4|nr:integrase [Mobiluncus mulieris]